MEYKDINAPIQKKPDVPETDSKIQTLKKLFNSAKLARSVYDKDWNKRWDYYKGRQTVGGRPYINLIRSTIQTMLPLLTDAKPGLNVAPTEPTDYAFSKTLQKLIEVWWEKPEVSMQHTLVEVLMDQSIYDAGILKVYYDPKAEHEMGDIRVKSVSPKNIYVNKEAIDFDKNCHTVIEVQRQTVSWLKTTFPEYSMYIKADTEDKTKNTDEEKSQYPVNEKQAISGMSPILNEGDCRETAEVWEIWIDSDELTEYEETNEDGTVTKGSKFKYPNGKLITMLPQQNLILQEVENPYKHGKKPYVRFIDALLPQSFWGEGEAETLIGAQNNTNLVLGNILAYTKLMANPVWILDGDSGVEPEDITNDFALVLKTKDGGMNKVKRDIPPALQAGITSLYDMCLRNAEIESGINDSTQGRRPTGITAASAIESLQEAAQTRIRLKERNMQTSLVKLGSMLIELFMQFYSSPRVTKITGPDGKDQWFEFYFSNENEGINLNKKEYNYIPEEDKYVGGDYTSTPSKGLFDVKILAGTSMPSQRIQRSNIAMQLRTMGVISDEELLNVLEWPISAERLQRKEEINKQV